MLFIPFIFLLSGCASRRKYKLTTPSLLPKCRTNKPYKIKNKMYIPQKHYELKQYGQASYYGFSDNCHGNKTATGERFNAYKYSAAHKTLPIPCVAKVTNLQNGKSIILKVNDRGPFAYNRIIDLSEAAARKLNFYKQGSADVLVETMVPETIEMITGKKIIKQRLITRVSRRILGTMKLLYNKIYKFIF